MHEFMGIMISISSRFSRIRVVGFSNNRFWVPGIGLVMGFSLCIWS